MCNDIRQNSVNFTQNFYMRASTSEQKLECVALKFGYGMAGGAVLPPRRWHLSRDRVA